MTKIELKVTEWTVYTDDHATGVIQHDKEMGYIFVLPDAFEVEPMTAADLIKIAELMKGLEPSQK